MLFAVMGKFANNFTFRVSPVDAADAREALGQVVGSDEIKNYGHAVSSVTVKALSGKNKKIKISDKPAAERKGGGRKKKEAPAASAPAPTQTKSRR